MIARINSFLATLKTAYSQQGQVGKILLPALLVLVFCCLCSILVSLFPSRNSPNPIPSPNGFPSPGNQPTPTALFDFDFPTFTPFPTFPPPTAFPTLTPLPTGSPTATQLLPTATGTPLPTVTLPPPATATATSAPSSGSLVIVAVNKSTEYVDIQNLNNVAVNLRGWRLVSETGNQSCPLRGTIQPNEVLRVWSGTGEPGFDCRFSFNIWNDNDADPAVLYDPQGVEVSRFP